MLNDNQEYQSDGEREAMEFLRQGRPLVGLSPSQFRRIECRLSRPLSPRRSQRLLLTVASLGLLLVAGSAAARVIDLGRLPLIGHLLSSSRSASAPRSSRTLRPASLPLLTPSAASGEAFPPGLALSAAQSAAPLAARPHESERVAPGAEAVLLRSPAREPADQPGGQSHSVAGKGAPRSLASARTHDGHGDQAAPLVGGESARMAESARSPAPGEAADWPGQAGLVALPLAPALPPAPPRAPSSAPTQRMTTANSVLSESQSLSAAVAEWHRNHDAHAALAALDTHERRFRGGQMQLETNLLRAEILLHEGREREGLALLDSVALAGLPRGRELATVRGELRIKFGRCREGRRDLNDVRAKDAGDDLGRRATRALTLCP